jgi:hypothetical protein
LEVNMEDALSGIAGVRSARAAGTCLAVALGCGVIPLASLAQDAVAPLDMVGQALRAERPEPAMRLELSAPALPSFESAEPGQHPRIDFSLLTSGTTGVGPLLGLNNFNSAARGLPGLGATPSTLDLGLHLRHTMQGNRQIDLTAWRRLAAEQDAYTLIQQRQPAYGARVEMKLSPARATPLLFDRSFIGLQLQGGARISIKRKDGRPMVYYRTTF